jgi:hypothetical protein
LKNFYRSPSSKWSPQYRKNSTLSDIIKIWYVGRCLCGIVVDILKMATGRNVSMSGSNSGHHNLPTYEMALKSDNVEFVRYCGAFWKWHPVNKFQCRESIRDIIIYPHIKF